MTGIQIQTRYSTGASRQAIEQALAAVGKDLGHLRPADLALRTLRRSGDRAAITRHTRWPIRHAGWCAPSCCSVLAGFQVSGVARLAQVTQVVGKVVR